MSGALYDRSGQIGRPLATAKEQLPTSGLVAGLVQVGGSGQLDSRTLLAVCVEKRQSIFQLRARKLYNWPLNIMVSASTTSAGGFRVNLLHSRIKSPRLRDSLNGRHAELKFETSVLREMFRTGWLA
jgi:hypothetical protein